MQRSSCCCRRAMPRLPTATEIDIPPGRPLVKYYIIVCRCCYTRLLCPYGISNAVLPIRRDNLQPGFLYGKIWNKIKTYRWLLLLLLPWYINIARTSITNYNTILLLSAHSELSYSTVDNYNFCYTILCGNVGVG